MNKLVIFFTLFVFIGAFDAVQAQSVKSQSVVIIDTESFYVHTVSAGDTFYSLGKLYDTTPEIIHQKNPLAGDVLQVGQVVKIPVNVESKRPLNDRQRDRLFTSHVVNQGETAYSISKRYSISLAAIIADNTGFDPLHLTQGQTIHIRIKSQGEASGEQLDREMVSYTTALNSVSGNFDHHTVVKGETLYSLSKTFNTPIDTIQKYNAAVLLDGLKLGSILRIPRLKQEQLKTESYTADDYNVVGGNTLVKTIDISAPIRVAVLLPLMVNGVANSQFAEFYQGFLMGLDDLKAMGISSQVDLFNTARSVSDVRDIVRSSELRKADLIVGPIYEDSFKEVADFAVREGIPIVSPLATMESVNNSLIYQVAAPSSTKYRKLESAFGSDKNVIVISGAQNDAIFAAEIAPLIPNSARRIKYNRDIITVDIENLLSDEKENTIVVLSSTDVQTDEILARLSSVSNNLAARGSRNPKIHIIGSSKWARFVNIDKNLLFKLNTSYVTSYQADRSNERVAQFDRKYVGNFNTLPTLFSYRGYDIAKLFVGSLKLYGNNFQQMLNGTPIPLLQTPYHFVQSDRRGKFVNEEWALVNYHSNYTIEVK